MSANRITSSEKHPEINAYYYSSTLSESTSYDSGVYQPSFSKYSSGISSIETRSSPLTSENLSKIQLAEPSSMPLARYCNEMKSAPYMPYFAEPPQQHRKSPQRRIQHDQVVESPRLLPFPYHNDSCFLPTAECDYPGGCSTTDGSSSMVSLSIHTNGSRQHLVKSPSITFPGRVYPRQLLSSPHGKPEPYYNNDDAMTNTASQKRREASVTPPSPTTLHDTIAVPQKNNRFASSFKKNLLRFKSSNSTILETSSSHSSSFSSDINDKSYSPPSSMEVEWTTLNDTAKPLPSRQQHNKKPKNNNRNIGWFEKLWKLLKHSSMPFVKKTSTEATADAPVWYSQFKCNPPPPSASLALASS